VTAVSCDRHISKSSSAEGVVPLSLTQEVHSLCQQLAQQQEIDIRQILLGGLRALSLRYEGLEGDAPSYTFRSLLADEAPRDNAAGSTLSGNGSSLYMQDSGAGEWRYDPNVFDAETVERVNSHFCFLLAALAVNPDKPISDPCFLSGEEWERAVITWNDTATNYPRNSSVAELFEQIAQKNTDRVAVVEGGESLTYGALDEEANRIAALLNERGVRSGSRVGLALDRSIAMVASMVGILKTGAAYVPLDADYPADRLRFMIEDTQLSAIITDRTHEQKIRCEVPIVRIDKDGKAAPDGTRVKASATADSTAYIMYTSGSTGTPKGVEVTQRGIVRLVRNATYVDFGPSEVFAQISNSSFDAITFEVWGALLNGARLVILPTSIVLSPESFAAAIEKHQLTAMFLTSSLFNVIAARCPRAFRTVRHLLVGGDAVDPRWSRHVLTTAPLDRIINGYGPTECTTFSVTHDIRDVPEGAKSVPIGRPLSNSQAYVLDWNMQPAPVGVPGELYLGGDGLAKGYWNRPELTAERFVPSPFDASGGARLYKTGDLARYCEDGVIECLGRTDQQVKIRGFRIELGEIETVLRQHPKIRDCAVVAGQDGSGAKVLWAYATTDPTERPGWPELRQFLRERLPEFMLPSDCLFLDEMPLSPNGKVDRKKLPPFEAAPARTAERSTAPKTEAQQIVAEVWEKVLGTREIGLDDNFFEVGGNSLLIAEVESELKPRFRTYFTTTDLFEHPTVRTIAARLAGAEGERNLVSSAHDRAQRQKAAMSGLRAAARRS
jgi:amino acid adenylation domain-containing protein